MIETKIARIISSSQVVLAAGKEHGAEEGMVFVIYALGEEIFDPENGNSLGRLELIKGKVKITHVQDKMSFATTPSRQVTRKVDPLAGLVVSPFGSREYTETVRDELEVEQPKPANLDLVVRVGDKARSVD